MTGGLGGDRNLRSLSSNKEMMPRKNPAKVKVSPVERFPPALKYGLSTQDVPVGV